MQKVKFQDQVYSVPVSPWDLTLDQYLELYVFLEEKGQEDYDLVDEVHIISIVSGIPEETLGDMTRTTVTHLLEICGKAILINEITSKGFEQDERKELSSFSASTGEIYRWQPNYNFARFGDIRRMEDFMANKKLHMFKKFYYVLANIAMMDGEKFDPLGVNRKAKKMLSVRMREIGAQMFCFLETRNALLASNKKAQDEEKEKEVKKERMTHRTVLRKNWGWYHVMMQRLIGEGKLCKTISDAEDLDMMTVMRYLVYITELDEVEKIEHERAKMTRR